MADQNIDTEFWVKRHQFTPTTHRDVYPAITPSNTSLSQAGKVIIVTGASQGLGKVLALSFAATRPKALYLAARNEAGLKETAASVKEQFPDVETLVVPTDVTNPASVFALFDDVKSKFGHAHVLVNNASVFDATEPMKDIDHELWWRELTVNVYGTFLVTQSFIKALPSSEQGKIILLNSCVVAETWPTASAYTLSKLATLKMQDFVSAENPNIFTAAVHPGMMQTDMLVDAFKVYAKDKLELSAGTVTWLAAWDPEDRSFLNGRYICANWDVDELVKRKDEIVEKGLLKMQVQGEFGHEQFQ